MSYDPMVNIDQKLDRTNVLLKEISGTLRWLFYVAAGLLLALLFASKG
jgi:hypothetical protein